MSAATKLAAAKVLAAIEDPEREAYVEELTLRGYDVQSGIFARDGQFDYMMRLADFRDVDERCQAQERGMQRMTWMCGIGWAAAAAMAVLIVVR